MSRTIALCFLAALFEGLDIQSMGVAAPRVASVLGLDPQRMGVVLSASIFGLMIGAAWGGQASDRYGRKAVLMLSMATFGIFSLLTTAANGFASMTIVRVLAGLGLGGTLPNLIAIATDVSPPRHRVTLLGIVYCGLPLGGALAGAIAGMIDPTSWKPVFVAGGIGPLLLVPLLRFGLPSNSAATPVLPVDDRNGERSILARGRRPQTLLLWTAYFFTLLAVYLLLNWLPSLMAAKGGDRATAPQAAIYLNIGAVIGSLLLGRLSDGRSTQVILVVTYAGMLASLLLLGVADRHFGMAACFCAGFFVIGGQLVLYALAPTIYPVHLRGTGIGAAVAVGRAGSVTGPLLGGVALSMGVSAAAVPAIAAPGLMIALVSGLLLVRRLTRPAVSALIKGAR